VVGASAAWTLGERARRGDRPAHARRVSKSRRPCRSAGAGGRRARSRRDESLVRLGRPRAQRSAARELADAGALGRRGAGPPTSRAIVRGTCLSCPTPYLARGWSSTAGQPDRPADLLRRNGGRGTASSRLAARAMGHSSTGITRCRRVRRTVSSWDGSSWVSERDGTGAGPYVAQTASERIRSSVLPFHASRSAVAELTGTAA
jgi:hypothetical protein